jgi:TctA family transporter
MATLVWSAQMYSGTIDDYIFFALCCAIGLLLKYIKFSRISFLIGFILSARLEKSYTQFTGLYEWSDLLETLPAIFIGMAIATSIWGIFFNKARIDFV